MCNVRHALISLFVVDTPNHAEYKREESKGLERAVRFRSRAPQATGEQVLERWKLVFAGTTARPMASLLHVYLAPPGQCHSLVRLVHLRLFQPTASPTPLGSPTAFDHGERYEPPTLCGETDQPKFGEGRGGHPGFLHSLPKGVSQRAYDP